MTDALAYSALKDEMAESFSFFDPGILGSAHFMYGNPNAKIIWQEGSQFITDFIRDDFAEWDEAQGKIPEGSRNKTLSLYAGKLVVRLGGSDEAHATRRYRQNEGTSFFGDRKDFHYLIIIDVEDQHHQAPNSMSKLTETVIAFCETIEKAGYYVMIYSCTWWPRNELNLERLAPIPTISG